MVTTPRLRHVDTRARDLRGASLLAGRFYLSLFESKGYNQECYIHWSRKQVITSGTLEKKIITPGTIKNLITPFELSAK